MLSHVRYIGVIPQEQQQGSSRPAGDASRGICLGAPSRRISNRHFSPLLRHDPGLEAVFVRNGLAKQKLCSISQGIYVRYRMYSTGLVREAERVLLLVDSRLFDGSHPPNRKAAHTHTCIHHYWPAACQTV